MVREDLWDSSARAVRPYLPSEHFPPCTDSSLLTPHSSPITMPLQNFGALAQRYYPDKTYRTATRLFRRELEVTKGLLRALKRVGYSPTSRLLTSTQVRVIEKFIGEAG